MRWSRPHYALHAEPQIELGFERLVFFQYLTLIECPLDGHEQFLVDQRLGQEIEGPESYGLDRRLDGAVAGNHDDRSGGAILATMGQQVKTVALAQADIDQRQIVGLSLDGGHCLGQARHRVGGIALFAEPVGHRTEQMAVVVYQ